MGGRVGFIKCHPDVIRLRIRRLEHPVFVVYRTRIGQIKCSHEQHKKALKGFKLPPYVDNLWLADWCHQWLSECWSCAQAFCRDVFLLGCCRCVHWWFFWVFGVTTVNMFSSVNKIVLTKLDEYFSAVVSNVWVLHGSSLHSALEYGHLEHIHLTR